MKTALVTGASRGIGACVAKRLAEASYEVAALARSKDELDALCAEIQAAGGTAFPIVCDVTKEQEVTRTYEILKEKWKTLDLLFNNAGANKPGTVELSLEDFRYIYDVNVIGAYLILHNAVPWMKEAKAGTIVNLASIAGTIGFPGAGAYCSTKFALRGLNESLHNELEPLGIRVTAISPSWVDTDMAAHCPFDSSKMIRPNDIAEAVLYIDNLGENVALKEMVIGCRNDLV